MDDIKSEMCSMCFQFSFSFVCVTQQKLIQAIKRIKHEVDECREAERETYIEAVEVEVLLHYYKAHYIWAQCVYINKRSTNCFNYCPFSPSSFRTALMAWNEKSVPSFRTSTVSWMRRSLRTLSD